MSDENQKKGPDHYRFYDTIGPEGVTIQCQRYIVIGETPMCFYVIRSDLAGYGPETIKRKRKRVLKDQGGRRHCYPDKVQAMRSYRVRKDWQIKHATISLERAKAASEHASVLVSSPELIGDHPHICEGGDYFKELNWGDC